MKKIDRLKALLKHIEERRDWLEAEAERIGKQGENEREDAMLGEANGLLRGVEVIDDMLIALREVIE